MWKTKSIIYVPLKVGKDNFAIEKGLVYVPNYNPTLTFLFNNHRDEYFEEVKENKRWRADEGGVYWIIKQWGDIGYNEDIRDGIDIWNYECGNYYRTKEIAEAYLERQKFLNEFRTFVEEENGDWKYSDKNRIGWCICRNFLDWEASDMNIYFPDNYVFETSKSVEKAIVKFGDKLFMLDPMWKPEVD